MQFGVCYYPEQWPESRWAEDARLMRAAGLDIVRIGEFAWANMEPAPGRFAWEWLDRACETLAAAGLRLILGTPTATPPAWLTQLFPESLRHDRNGRVRAHGSRRHYCPNNPTYREHSRRIVAEMGQRYGRLPALIGWQIDNEFGGGHTARCACPHCLAAFHIWLQTRYGHLDALNAAWGTVFWSQTYTDWGQIALPDERIDKRNPSQELDYFRFASDSFVTYQQEQIDVLRVLSPGRFVTHNFMGLYRDLNQFDLAAALDFVAWDNYPTGNPERWRPFLRPPESDTSWPTPNYAPDAGDPVITGMAHALMRGLKQAPFGVMEQQVGHINWGRLNPGIRPDLIRLWVWQAVAEGATTMVYFRWRASLYAQEQYHSGLRNHAGEPDVGWRAQQRLQADRPLLEGVADAPLAANIGLLVSYDDLWALQLQPHGADFDHWRHVYVYYHALRRQGTAVDLIPLTADLSRYGLLIAPTWHLADAAQVSRLREYVAAGGTLLLGVRSGFKTVSNCVTDQPLPGLLRELVGARVLDWQALPPGVGWGVKTAVPGLAGPAMVWAERLQPETAVSLAEDDTGAALLTENRVGKGRVLYLGWYPTGAQAVALVQALVGETAVAALPPGVLAYQRGTYRLWLNFTDQPQIVPVDGLEITIPPRDLYLVV